MYRRKSTQHILKKTALSATYPAPGVRTYGKSNTDLSEIINRLHEAGYVIDQNLLSHIFNAIIKIAIRDGFCFASKYGLFYLVHNMDKEQAAIDFRPSLYALNIINAHLGIAKYHQDIDKIDKDNDEIAHLFEEIIALDAQENGR